MKLRLLALVLAGSTVAGCGDTNTSSSPSSGTVAADSTSGFCPAMAQLIVLLAPSETPTSPAETKATFEAAAVQFERGKEAAPASIATEFADYAAAYDEYVHYLSTVDYNLDLVFSTEEGTQLAIETSHSLTPSIVQYSIDQCGLSFGEEEHEPPTT